MSLFIYFYYNNNYLLFLFHINKALYIIILNVCFSKSSKKFNITLKLRIICNNKYNR